MKKTIEKQENFDNHIKEATIYRCEKISVSDQVYKHIIWEDETLKEPVYVKGENVISLINGKKYPILKHTLEQRIKDIGNIEEGKFYVVDLHPLPSSIYTEKHVEILKKEAEKIHHALLQKEKSKQKAYS